ncbi:PRC-barrel domain-containing protein [Acidisoma cladoniae]|uniref:PRC-barrel domain-containing protein n=1 Tax=Acidisoma cladoniae TaxID=3040935 RepID=UPI00254AF76A|nr:PRC-barrel domain-containing protein [Acidisoma sp. PAMC 29798]
MLVVLAAFKGYAIEATDGSMGTVSDFLFDDMTWKVRWLVVDTGTWLKSRRVVVHPAAIRKVDYERRELLVTLKMAQVEASPGIGHDQPVSRQAELDLYEYYGWDPIWGGGGYFGARNESGAGGVKAPLSRPLFRAPPHQPGDASLLEVEQDPHLRSAAAMNGYHVHATEGTIGHIENLLVDDTNWDIRYVIIDTRDWWPGSHVLISPYAVTAIRWEDHDVRLNVTIAEVKSSPEWDPFAMVTQVYEKELHHHYNWPGYGSY